MLVIELERRKSNMSQSELGQRSNVDQSYISTAERHGHMYPKHLERVAQALGFKDEPQKLLEEVS